MTDIRIQDEIYIFNINSTVKNILQSLKNYPILPAIKEIVESQKGEDWHVMRPPLISLNEQQKQELIESLKLLED